MNVTGPVSVGAAHRPVDFPISPIILPGLARALDVVLLLAIGFVSAAYLNNDDLYPFRYAAYFTLFVSFAYVALAERADLFTVNTIMRPTRRADDLFIAVATAFLLFLSIAFALEASSYFARGWVMSYAATSALAVTLGRLALCRALRRLSRNRTVGRSMVVLGVGEQSRRFLDRLARTSPFFLDVVGVYRCDGDPGVESVAGYPVLGDVEDLMAAARERKIDDVLVAMPWSAGQQLADTVERLKELPINVFLGTDLIGFELAFRPAMGHLTELPMFEVVQRPISGWSSALKTIEDYVLAGIILILISPLMLAIALVIKMDSPGPVFFMQKRLGFNNKEFSIYKFRSMYHRDTSERVVRQATRGDPRVTRVGRIIRATSLDELPQLLNVLNGTMSLVGPRPHAISHNEEYGRQIRGYFSRHKVKPGITGWAQVCGHRGETDTLEKMTARIQHDIYYTENWSILFDIRILMMTAFVAFFQKTAY